MVLLCCLHSGDGLLRSNTECAVAVLEVIASQVEVDRSCAFELEPGFQLVDDLLWGFGSHHQVVDADRHALAVVSGMAYQ